MKKLWHSASYKRYNKYRSRKSLKKKLQHKDFQRRNHLGQRKGKKEPQKSSKKINYRKVKAPNNFSFINNPEQVVDFVANLERFYNKKRAVFVKLEEVEFIDYGALVVLLSIMIQFKTNNIPFNGNKPQNMIARDKLDNSEFFKHLYGKKSIMENDRYSIGQVNKILTNAQKKVDSVLCDKLIENASKTVWKEKRKCPGVYRTLIELMQNTNNHAEIGKPGEKYWWLSVTHDKQMNKVTFSFVDFGVGIFESLNSKDKSRSKFAGWITKMSNRFKYGNNSELLKLILEGELHATVTNKHFRGKGLPGIKESLLRNQFSNLHVISNDVFVDVSNEHYKMLSNQFSGTFVYFELISSNHNLSENGNDKN